MNDIPMMKFLGISSVFLLSLSLYNCKKDGESDSRNFSPIVINTWKFSNATSKALMLLNNHSSALDAVEKGVSVCEIEQCDGSVGYGGHPDEVGETTLDAMIMDGTTMETGAVSYLRRIKTAISVARAVMERTTHTMLAGSAATNFAKEMGFIESDLHTPSSKLAFKNWKNNSCQPNCRKNVYPDPKHNCGPYRPTKTFSTEQIISNEISYWNHDTIGMIAIDSSGNVVSGTSTNGLNHKVPGRVADSSIPGAGSYADSTVGGSAATGDGDVMMRFLPSFRTVENMRRGMSPTDAAKDSIHQIVKYYSQFSGAVIALRKDGAYGAACHGIAIFPYSVGVGNVTKIETVECL